MKITAVARTSRSNSLPVAIPVCRSGTEDARATTGPDTNHSRGETASTQSTSQPTAPGQTRTNDVEAARGNSLEPIQDESYVSIEAITTERVGEDVQVSTGDGPSDSIGNGGVACDYVVPVSQRGRLFANCPKSKRLVQKDGRSNVSVTKVQKKNRRYIRDLFTTIMDLKWRYHVLLFISCFILSWLLFGVGWLALAYFHGDIERAEGYNATDICLSNVYDFSTALLYSLETQTTIGYGYRVIGPNCPLGTTLLMAQSCMGIFIQCFITGIVFAKIARPNRRSQTIVFSQNAVICMRDGFYNLIFRVGDLRKTHIIGTSIRALLVKSRLTTEGELIPLCQYPLELATESSITDSFIFFFWPVTIAHRITETSPLWNLSAETILSEHFEMIVILEGTVQTSGALIQIRTSYVPNEIKWGQRLTPLVINIRSDDECDIDYSNFHDTTPATMPDCSADVYSKRMANNRVDPVESDYPSSFTSPAILGKDVSYNIRRISKSHRLQTLFQRNRTGLRLKITRAKDGRAEPEGAMSRSSTETNLATLTPPPTYASLARKRLEENFESMELDSPGIWSTVSIPDELNGATASDGHPGWSFGGRVNRPCETSMA